MMVEEVMPRKRKKLPRTEALATSYNSPKIITLVFQLLCDTHVTDVTAPPPTLAVERAVVEELPHDASPSSLQDEVEALGTPQEAVVEAEKASGADQDSRLPKKRRKWPRLSFNKIFTKFMVVKSIGRWTHKGVYMTSIILLSVALV